MAAGAPTAALTVDRYDEDWSKLAWVQALGEVQLLEASADPEAVAALEQRYQDYLDRPPSGLLLSLEPERLVWWRAWAG